ncbi:MAG TPA: chromate efflux transporter [Candidatus Binataceae bacterium]|nr:chromate efflux transporter [Candidatus Binataceae bacterium]
MAAEFDPSAAGPRGASPDSRGARLRELAGLFFRLGTTAFGGPAANIAMMEEEVVRRRQWLTHAEFLDMIGACNLIPGPNSTEMAIHLGHRRAGFAGLAVAGACFIVPAAAITMAVAWVYVRFGAMPAVGGALYGIKPVIIVIVLQALWRLGVTAARTPTLIAITAAATIAAFMGVNEMAILLGAGILTVAIESLTGAAAAPGGAAAAIVAARALPVANSVVTASPAAAQSAIAGGVVAGVTVVAAPFSLTTMFLLFAKIGAVLFGSGYVLLAFLQADFVDRLHWLTQGQLLDAVAVGQFTPGPVFCTATFIGYLLGRTPGAIVATAGIFLPAFAFVAISGPLLPRLRRSPIAGALLDGVNAASLALMVAVTWQLGRAAIIDATTVAITIVGGVMLMRLRLNSAWIVTAGALLGILAFKLHG